MIRRSKGRSALTILLALLLALAAAGCGGDDDEGGGEGAAADEEIGGTVDVWAMGAEGEKLDVLAKDFMAQNPGVTVKVTPIAWEIAHDKLLTSVAGGQTPDVSQMGTTWMGEFAATGALEEVPDSIDMESFFEGARNTAIIDDTPMGVPWYVETRLLYYRKDIAEKAGITEPPANWDELKAMAKAMKEKGGARYGIALAPDNWQEFLPFVWQTGGEVTEGENWNFDSPEVVEALEYYKSFFDEGLTAESVPEGFAVEQGFVEGTHPMFFSGPWHMSLIEELGGPEFEGKWAIAPMPEKDSRTSFVGGSDLVVFKDSDNKDAAWKFVEYLTTPETQVTWYDTAAALPSTTAGWEDPSIADDEQIAVFRQQLDNTKAQPSISTWNEISSVINDEMERVIVGDATPEEGAQAMQEKATSIGTD